MSERTEIHLMTCAPNMAVRANLQPHLVNLIAGLRRYQVEEAVALLLDYIDAGRAATCRSNDKVQAHQSVREAFEAWANDACPWAINDDSHIAGLPWLRVGFVAGMDAGRLSMRAEAAQAPIVQHAPADDTEGGAT